MQLPDIQVDCTSFNLNSPISNNEAYKNTIKQTDETFFAPENRIGVSASILPALVGLFTPTGRQLAGFGQKMFDDTACAYDLCDALSMVIRSYGSTFAFPSPEKSQFSQLAMKAGKDNEDHVRNYINANNSFKDDTVIYPVANCTADQAFIKTRLALDQLPDLPAHLSASPDGILVDPLQKSVKAIIEIKTRASHGFRHGKSFPLFLSPEKTVPVYHMVQVQWQMLITGVDTCYYISWTTRKGASVFLVEFNKDLCTDLIHWVHLLKRHLTDPIWETHTTTNNSDLQSLIRQVAFTNTDDPKEFFLDLLTNHLPQQLDRYNNFLATLPDVVSTSSKFVFSI